MSMIRCSECNCLIDTDFDSECEKDSNYPMCRDCRQAALEAQKEDERLDDPRHTPRT